MAVIGTIKSYRVTVKTNAGTTETGKVITESVSLGTMQAGADHDKIMSVVDALKPCLEHEVYDVEETVVKILNN